MKMHRSGSKVPGAAFGSQDKTLGFLILRISPTSLLTGVGRCLYDYARIPISESFRFMREY